VLEHRPRGLAGAEEGPLPERPLLAPWLRRADVGGATLLEYGDAIVALEGESVPGLLRLLDGTRDPSRLTPAERDAVAALAAEGVVVPGPAVADDEALREAAGGRVAPAEAERRLRAARVALAGSGAVAAQLADLLPGRTRRVSWTRRVAKADLAVAAPAPEELPRLADWNRHLLATETPWLLVLPFNGRFATVGPLFLPGATCCYACLVRRRAAALPDPAEFLALESVPAPYPSGRSLAAVLAGAAALLAARWLARGDAALAGAFLALELTDGLGVTRHRVLRVPRCEACSPAASEPPLLPWASADTR
jgi:bacteriocin biosynthesis cyclodehydratase domain-containing protein